MQKTPGWKCRWSMASPRSTDGETIHSVGENLDIPAGPEHAMEIEGNDWNSSKCIPNSLTIRRSISCRAVPAHETRPLRGRPRAGLIVDQMREAAADAMAKPTAPWLANRSRSTPGPKAYSRI